MKKLKLELLRTFTLWYIKYLQKRYKAITVKNINHNQSNQVLAELMLIQSKLYYYKRQFSAWGMFHYDCTWSPEDQVYFDKLFPEIDFKEIDIVIWHKPEAVTYYRNEIYLLSKGISADSQTIIKHLKKWKDHN